MIDTLDFGEDGTVRRTRGGSVEVFPTRESYQKRVEEEIAQVEDWGDHWFRAWLDATCWGLFYMALGAGLVFVAGPYAAARSLWKNGPKGPKVK